MNHMRKRRHKKFRANKYDKLVVDIKNNLITRLGDLMSKLLNSAPDKIFTLAENAANNEDQNYYFDLMNKLRSQKSDIASSYITFLKKYLVPAAQYKTTRKSRKNIDESELSLVAQDEMEGMVLVKGTGERANALYREQLSHLEARLEHLALKSSATFSSKALSATNFCQAFEDTIKLYFNNSDKKILFSMFEAEVTNKLESVYDSINNRLIDADILPQIKLNLASAQPKRRQSDQQKSDSDGANHTDIAGHTTGHHQAGSSCTTSSTESSATGGSDQTFSQPFSHGSYAMTATPGGTYHKAASTDFNHTTINNEGESSLSRPAVAHSEQQTTIPQPSSENQPTDNDAPFTHYTAGIPARQVGEALSSFFGTPVNQKTFTRESHQNGGTFFPASTHADFGHQEILQALSSLQAMPQFVQPEQMRFDAEAIKQAVIKELANATGGVVTKRINQIAEKTIDFIELVFDAIIDDDDISDTIKTLLLRLQIPVIKASMSDQEFFIYDDHPARVLLDKIAESGIGVTDHNDEMYRQLDRIITNLLAENDLTTETFKAALQSLNTVIEKQEEIARQKEQDAQQQTLRSHARNTVLKALRTITTGKKLPEAVHPLILKRWPTLMFNHYLQFGKENDEWVNLIETLRDIIESIQPIKTAEDLAILQADKDEILELTYDYLSQAIKSKSDIEHVLNGLSDTYDKHIQNASFSAEEIKKAEEIITETMHNEDSDTDSQSNIIHINSDHENTELPKHAIPGTWFQLFMGEDQTDRRCKLSVIIPEDANMMFVNHKGELIIEKSFSDFNAEIASKKTRVIMEHSAFDHALKTVVTTLPVH